MECGSHIKMDSAAVIALADKCILNIEEQRKQFLKRRCDDVRRSWPTRLIAWALRRPLPTDDEIIASWKSEGGGTFNPWVERQFIGYDVLTHAQRLRNAAHYATKVHVALEVLDEVTKCAGR